MKLIGFDTRGILCGRKEQMLTSKSGKVAVLHQIARQSHVVDTIKLKVKSLKCVSSLNARMQLTGFDRRGILYARRAQMVPSKLGAMEFLQQIERENPVLSTNQFKFAPLICATALNAGCSTEQKQVITGEAPVITHLPGEEKSVELDEGGSGFPPDDSDSGGGGGNWLGGFFFSGLLAFLGFLEDKESEGGFHCYDWTGGGFNTSHFMSIPTYYLHKILPFINIFPAWVKLPFATFLVMFAIIEAFEYFIRDVCLAVSFFCFLALLFILVLGVFVVRILCRYNLLTGSTGRGSSDGRLSRLLNWRYRSADSSSELTSHANEHFNPECCICLAEYEDDEEVRMLPCSHRFHLECVNQWLRIRSFCPLCKQNV